MLKVYDLVITNVDLFASVINHEVMFQEYSRNMPQMYVSKIFQGYPQNIITYENIFRSQKVQKIDLWVIL